MVLIVNLNHFDILPFLQLGHASTEPKVAYLLVGEITLTSKYDRLIKSLELIHCIERGIRAIPTSQSRALKISVNAREEKMDDLTSFILQELAFEGDLGKNFLAVGSNPRLGTTNGGAPLRFRRCSASRTHLSILYNLPPRALPKYRRQTLCVCLVDPRHPTRCCRWLGPNWRCNSLFPTSSERVTQGEGESTGRYSSYTFATCV